MYIKVFKEHAYDFDSDKGKNGFKGIILLVLLLAGQECVVLYGVVVSRWDVNA